MATNTIRSYITIRNDTIENWTSSNSILKKGELALSLENGSFSLKAGDGSHVWRDLPYLAVHSSDIKDLESVIQTKIEELTVDTITTDEKERIDSFTIEDVEKWKDGYDELQDIKSDISQLESETVLSDTSTVGEVVNTLNVFMTIFNKVRDSE